MTLVSCARFYVVPKCKEINVYLNIKVNNNFIDEVDYSGLIYDWDEEKYGVLIDKNIDTVTCVVLDYEGKESIVDVIRGKEKRLDVKYPNKYDLVIHNKTKETLYYGNNEQYISETVYSDTTYNFNYTEPQKSLKQSEKQYTVYEKDIFSAFNEEDLTIDKMEKNDDNTYTYNCYIDRNMIPVSFTYVVQIIIYDDDPLIPFSVDKCDYIGISGLAKNVDLIELKTSEEQGIVETSDVKPFQHIRNCYVCCAKIRTYGLHSGNSSSSWAESRKCELGVEFVLINGNKKRGMISVLNRILDNPHGGVISLGLNNSEIYDGGYIDGGIIPDVAIWDDVIIDIPF